MQGFRIFYRIQPQLPYSREFFLFLNKMKKENIGGEKSKVIRNGVRTQSDMQQYWTKENQRGVKDKSSLYFSFFKDG
jgi:hypothetical protein